MTQCFVHSTCGQPMTFKFYRERKKGDVSVNSEPLIDPKTRKPVEIQIGGGAYVLNRESGKMRKVVITEVTEEELALLESHPAFKEMKARGFFTVRTVSHMEADAHGNPTDMEKRDNTSQILDEDHAKGTDHRLESNETRAFTGEANQVKGLEPEGDQLSYGQIQM